MSPRSTEKAGKWLECPELEYFMAAEMPQVFQKTPSGSPGGVCVYFGCLLLIMRLPSQLVIARSGTTKKSGRIVRKQ